MKRLLLKRVPIWVLAVVAMVIVALFSLLNQNIEGDITALRSDLSTVDKLVIEEQGKVSALERQLKLAKTSDFIANEARTHHAFLAPGEIRFEVVNKELLFAPDPVPEQFKNRELHNLPDPLDGLVMPEEDLIDMPPAPTADPPSTDTP